MATAMSFCVRSKVFQRYSQQDTKFYSLLGLNGARLPTKMSSCLLSRRYAGGIGGPTPGQIMLQGEDAEEPTQTERKKTQPSWSPTFFRMFESAATTFASILVLGLAGYGYHRVCKLLDQDVSYIGLLFNLQAIIQEQKAVNARSSCLIIRLFALGGGMLTPKYL